MLDQVFQHELGEKGYKEFCEKNDVDFAIMVGEQRFRANGYRTMHGWAMVLRTLSPKSRILTSLACRLLFIRY